MPQAPTTGATPNPYDALIEADEARARSTALGEARDRAEQEHAARVVRSVQQTPSANRYLALLEADARGSAPAPAAPVNPYLDLLERDTYVGNIRRNANLHTSVNLSADAYAAQKRAAAYLGYPVGVIAARPEEGAREVKIKQVQDDTAAAPVLAHRYTDEDFARLAHDDSAALRLLETLGNSFRRGWPGLKQTLAGTALRANAGSIAQVDAAQALLDAGKKGLTLEQDPHGIESMAPGQRQAYRQQLDGAVGHNATSIATAQAEKARFPAPQVTSDVMGAKTFGEAFAAFARAPVQFIASIGPESLVQNLPGLAAAALMPGGVAAKAATTGFGSASIDYGSQIIEGLSKAGVDISNPAAVAAAARDPKVMKKIASEAIRHAGVVGAVDAMSAGLASKLALPGKLLTKAPVARELANMGVQTPMQGALGALGEAGGEVAAGQPLDPGSILAEAAGEAFGAPAEVASIAGGRVRERMSQAREAKAHAATLEQFTTAVQASKLKARDAGVFAEFTKDATEHAEVFIDAHTFAQSVKPEQLAKLPEGIKSQLPEALASGGDISIPVGDLAAHLGDVPELVQHLRATPEAMSAAEATAHTPDQHLRDEIAALSTASEAPADATGADPRADALAQARQTVLDQLTAANRFTPQVNAKYVDLMSAFVSTTAERAGLDVAGIQALIPRVVSQLTAPRAQTLEQSTAPHDSPEFRHWFADSKVKTASGSPQVVYRGGPTENWRDGQPITEFRSPNGPWAGFFTSSTATASRFAAAHYHPTHGGANAPAVVPVYLRIEKPLEVDAKGRPARDFQIDASVVGKPDSPLRAQFLNGDFDGLILRNTGDEGDVFVARHAEQVKSAIGNDGAFDPNDPSFLHADNRRGAFDPTTKTIALLEHADLSTFLHETGHFFLDATVDQALREDAPAGVKADVQALMHWFGVADAQTWNALSLDEQREHHEAFARGFERYLMEGKAPTAELQTLFGRFRSWLLAIYKKLDALSVDPTPEVRGVMDRMLATDAQIAETTAARSLRPMFKDAQAAGMGAEAFAAYQAHGTAATEAAVGELQGKALRDMQFISRSKERAVRKLTAEARAKRAAIEAEVAAEVYATPIYAAWRDLSRGHTEDGQPIRLSRADVERSHPELVARMPQSALANSERALPAEMVAEAYGLSSGDELVRLLATIDKPATVIEGETDQRMLQRHGELIDQRAIEEAAHGAVANDARARVLTTEADALATTADA